MGIVGGILLPESIISSWWFQLLAVVVALNTIVYMGLTLSKLIPLPKPVPPERIRELLKMNNDDGVALVSPPSPQTVPSTDIVVPSIKPRKASWGSRIATKLTGGTKVPTQIESGDTYEDMRSLIAKRDIPQAFAFVGGFVILLSFAGVIILSQKQFYDNILELAVGVIFLLLGQIFWRNNFSGRTVMWSWSIACVLLVETLILDAILSRTQTPLAYTLVVLVIFIPITLAYRPAVFASVIMFLSIVISSMLVAGDEDLRISLSTLAGLIGGFMLLRLRLVALATIADERDQKDFLATTDVMTGVLSKHGLLSLMPSLGGLGVRFDHKVCVMFFRIEGLDDAERMYGVLYRESLLKGIAQAISSHVRLGDLVGRWDDESFVVAGLGEKPNLDSLEKRIIGAVQDTGVDLGRAITNMNIGVASGDPSVTTFDALLISAEKDV